jgi:RNA recognition motif. (a.k.a. RRM, RBD, or RNP domain)
MICAWLMQGPSEAQDPPGFGYVFVEFETEESAVKAQALLNGRKFGPGRVAAKFYDAPAFRARNFTQCV